VCPRASGPLIFGKQGDARIHPAALFRLGTWRCRAHLRCARAVFAPLQVVLPTDPGNAVADQSSTTTIDLEAAADQPTAQNAGTIG
jgi:hypothetical protein